METILKHKNTFIASALFVYSLYAFFALSSFGFDDEFYNFNIIENFTIPEILAFNINADFHPLLSYFINLVLYRVSGSWDFVRLVSAVLVVSAMVWAGAAMRRQGREAEGLLLLVLLGTSPSLLLWGASVRWYAYFLAVLIWLSLPPENQGARYWHKLFAGSYLLANLGYIAILAFFPLLVIYWRKHDGLPKDKVRQILKIGPIYLLLYLPQLYLLFAIQIHNGEPQMHGLFRSATGYYLGQVSNQGVFPLSPAGMLGLAGFLLAAFYILVKPGKQLLNNTFLLPYVVFTLSVVLLGFAGKFRNVVVLEPFFALVLCASPFLASRSKGYMLALGLIITSSVVGQYNIFQQEDTIKSSWNISTRKALRTVATASQECRNFAVLVHDPTLTREYEALGYPVFGPLATQTLTNFPSDPACVFVVLTYPGSMTQTAWDGFNAKVSGLDYESRRAILQIPDRYAGWKQRMDERVPDNAIEIIQLTGVSGFDRVTD